ncbi:MAG: peptide chain release factor N(5)-glutamine methyltransferase, partial [Clostridium sp.]|nr:peptide chain release factor N(5)-glutamine methyltransferase [Clostridium sp.]
MTLRQTYQKGKMLLEKAGIETPAFDAVCLFEKVFGMDRQKLMIHGMEPAEEAHAAAYWELCEMRAQGRPLQYILGEWPFMDFTLCVGEGVLVPREETELLVYTAAERLRVGSGAKGPWKGVDLCGGSGAVAIGLASLLPGLEISCAELYADAFRFLEANVRRLASKAVHPARLDVLSPESAAPFSGLDLVVSNPPYVEAG